MIMKNIFYGIYLQVRSNYGAEIKETCTRYYSIRLIR